MKNLKQKNFTISLIQNIRGSSTAAVLIISALVATTAIGVMDLSNNINQSERFSRQSAEAHNAMNFAALRMALPNVCSKNFIGRPVIAGEKFSVSEIYGLTASGDIDSSNQIMVAGVDLSNNLRVHSMEVQVSTAPGAPPNYFVGTLKTQFELTSPSGTRMIPRQARFGIVSDVATSTLIGCSFGNSTGLAYVPIPIIPTPGGGAGSGGGGSGSGGVGGGSGGGGGGGRDDGGGTISVR